MAELTSDSNLPTAPALFTGTMRLPRRIPIEREAARVIILLAIVHGLLTDALFFRASLGLNGLLWFTVIAGDCLLVYKIARGRPSVGLVVLFVASLLPATLLVLRVAPALVFLDVCATLGLMTLAVTVQGRSLRTVNPVLLLGEPITAIEALIVGPAQAISKALERREPLSTSMRSLIPVAQAAVVAVPLIVVFGALFVTADAVIETQVRDAFDINLAALDKHLFWFVLGTGAAFLPMWRLVAFEPLPTATLDPPTRIGAREVAVILAPLALIFALFVAVQVRYLFGGHDLVQRTIGLTYAEYAHRGFFQLVLAALLLLPVLLAVNWWRSRESRPYTTFIALATVLGALLFVVMTSAYVRLEAYVDAFGLTILRFYAVAALPALGAACVLLLAIVTRKAESYLLPGGVVLALAFVVALNIVSPDSWIARTNMTPKEDRPFDAAYLVELSDDALPTIVDRIDQLPPNDACALVRQLTVNHDRSSYDIRDWNLGRAQASDAYNRQPAVDSVCP